MLQKIYLDKRGTVNGRDSVLNLQNFVNLNAHILAVVGASSVTTVVVENTLFVMNNGDDSTGLRTRLDKPFATIQAAMAAASVQDTVIVYAGTYTATTGDVVLKLGVKLKMEPGAVLNITTCNAAMFEFGSGNGIYGEGAITINNALTASAVFLAPNADSIVLECDIFLSTNFSMHFDGYGSVDIGIRNLLLVDCTLLSFDGRENMVLDAKIHKYTSFGSSAHISIEQFTGGTADIHINYAVIGDLCLDKGFLYSESCSESACINVTVNRLINNNESDSATLGDQALVTNDRCFANKHYVFNYVEVYGKLYAPIGTGSALFQERGYMKFVGKIKTNASTLSAVYTWIDFSKRNQYITFDLDIVDETTPVFGIALDQYEYFALLNVNSDLTYPGQYVTGRIETPRATGRGVIVYGTGSTALGDISGNTATLLDLTVITGGMPSFHLNTVGFGVLPTRNCITNLTPDITVVFAIETPIDDVNVR